MKKVLGLGVLMIGGSCLFATEQRRSSDPGQIVTPFPPQLQQKIDDVRKKYDGGARDDSTLLDMIWACECCLWRSAFSNGEENKIKEIGIMEINADALPGIADVEKLEVVRFDSDDCRNWCSQISDHYRELRLNKRSALWNMISIPDQSR